MTFLSFVDVFTWYAVMLYIFTATGRTVWHEQWEGTI